MESALSLLAANLSAPHGASAGSSTLAPSPTKCTAAISAIEDNENLEPEHFIAAINLILKTPGVATSHLAIRKPAAWTAFLQYQLSIENGIAFEFHVLSIACFYCQFVLLVPYTILLENRMITNDFVNDKHDGPDMQPTYQLQSYSFLLMLCSALSC